MRLGHARFAGVVVLAPSGRVDHATAELRTDLAPYLARCGEGQDHVVLDLAGVDYIGSAGRRVLMLAAKQAKTQTGDSYGYRFERDGRALVYSTDSEHQLGDHAETQAFADFFRDADLVIFDAQYSLAEAISIKEDWGHSSNVVGFEGITRGDHPVPVSSAWDGMEIDL